MRKVGGRGVVQADVEDTLIPLGVMSGQGSVQLLRVSSVESICS